MRQCLDLLEACLSPPVPRDCGEQAFLSCCCCCSCLTLLPCSCHLSFLVWVLTSFWGSRIQHQGLCAGPSMPHSHCSPQGPGQGAAARPSVFLGAVTGRLRHTWETPPPLRPRGAFPAGGRVSSCCCLWPLFLFWTLRSPLCRLTLELDLISLTRPVILSSSPSTFQSILGASAAQQGQPSPCGGPWPQAPGLRSPLVLLWFSVLPVYSPNCSSVYLLSLAFSSPPNPALVLASVGERNSMLGRRNSVCRLWGNFVFTFLILVSSFIYALVAQVLQGSADPPAFQCL